jgi:hypothetical protein
MGDKRGQVQVDPDAMVASFRSDHENMDWTAERR